MKCWEALAILRQDGPTSIWQGICRNVELVDPIAACRYHQYAAVMYEDWPLYSGELSYPVPSGDAQMSPRDAYWKTPIRQMWRNSTYAENRRALLDFAIEWFKERGL